MPGSGRRRGGVLLAILAVVIVFAAVVSALRAGDDSSSKSDGTKKVQTVESDAPGIGKPAPGFTVRRLTGPGSISLSDYRGRVVLVNFWASYCVPCRKEFPTFHELVADHPSLPVIGVTYRDITSDARDFARKYGATWLLACGGDGDPVAKSYGIRAIPQTFVIDAKGRITKRFFGGPSLEALDAAVAEAKRA